MNRYKPIFKMIGEAWKIEKRYFLILFCSIIIQTGLTIISMYIPAAIVDRLSNNYSFVDIFKMILVFMAVSYLLKQGLEFVNLHFQKMSIYQSKRLEARISEKAMSITYKELENPESGAADCLGTCLAYLDYRKEYFNSRVHYFGTRGNFAEPQSYIYGGGFFYFDNKCDFKIKITE